MKIMKFCLSAIAVAITNYAAHAQEHVAPAVEPCPLQKDLLLGMCRDILLRRMIAEDDTTDLVYFWEARLIQLACADGIVDPALRMTTIRKWWHTHKNDLICPSDKTQYVLRPHVLAYAIGMHDEDFVRYLIEEYKLELDMLMDIGNDTGTVMDYLVNERGRNPQAASTYDKFYRWLKDAGARHASEL